jgi:hypothetical protein
MNGKDQLIHLILEFKRLKPINLHQLPKKGLTNPFLVVILSAWLNKLLSQLCIIIPTLPRFDRWRSGNVCQPLIVEKIEIQLPGRPGSFCLTSLMDWVINRWEGGCTFTSFYQFIPDEFVKNLITNKSHTN